MKQFKQRITRVLASGIFVGTLLIGSPSFANINFQIGISKGDIVRTLSKKGYSQIKVYKKGFKTGKAYACKNGLKYDVKVDVKGRVKGASKIGSCRNQVSQKQVIHNLKANGFRRIVIDEQNNNYVVIACKGEQRTRLIVSYNGRLLKKRNLGECQDVFEPNDVRQVLRSKGYNRINFTDRQLPWYGAEACFNESKVELRLTRRGEIKKQQRIGRCDAPINIKNINSIMRNKGYDRVSVINNRPPRYLLEACADNSLYNIALDQYGKITKREHIGQCKASVNQKQIAQLLRDEGFTRVNINQRKNGIFNISACLDGYEKFVKLNKFGELIEEIDGQQCQSRSISEINNSLNKDGFQKTQIYAEACRKGRKIRITLNEFGDRIGRKRIGKC